MTLDFEKLKNSKKRKPKEIYSVPFDWERIDKGQNENRKIYTPTQQQKAEFIKTLKMTMRSPAKKSLISQLSLEFARQYQRYRRALQRDAGKQGIFMLVPASKKHTEKGAQLCIHKNITPVMLFKFWHEHMDEFFDDKLKAVPLTFITSEHAIETAACVDLEKEKEKTKFGNSFQSVNQLDPKIRAFLRKGGFPVQNYSELFILNIQHAAITMTQGVDLFVAPKIKKPAKYLADNYYMKKTENEE